MSGVRSKVYLLDVEGTIAPLSLTTEVLFPYARAHFEGFLREALDLVPAEAQKELRTIPRQGNVMPDLLRLAAESSGERDRDAPRVRLPLLVPESGSEFLVPIDREKLAANALDYIYWLMDRDRKSTALKSLQGKIWKAGFESGELKGTLFDDVAEALQRWSAGEKVAIYSSGSVEAQKLFFRYSSHGDLTALISCYFDTRTGAKVESASYAAIAREMAVATGNVLFFSDAVPELDAARSAGCGTRLVIRPGNAPVEDSRGHVVVESFANV